MMTMYIPAISTPRSPFQEYVRSASPEQLTDLVLTTLNDGGISSSPTVWQGWVTVHSSDLDWDLYCIVTNTHATKPMIEIAAVSAAWCESPELHKRVCDALTDIGLRLNRTLDLPVLIPPVPRWF